MDTEGFPFLATNEDCPVKCELSTDKSRAQEADALVTHCRDAHAAPSREKFPNHTFILHCNENPQFTGSLKNAHFMSQFNFLMSYHLKSDFCCPQMIKPGISIPVPFEDKWGLVFWASSHCERVRTTYVYNLMRYMKIDSYGRCLNNKEGLKGKHFKLRNGEISRFYKFQLIFQNADCDYWVDEKLFIPLESGTVPVIMGSDKIVEFLPGRLRHSVIFVRDFDSPKKLADHLLYLSENKNEYNKYLEWKFKGHGFPLSFYDSCLGQWWESRYKMYCRVCMELAKGNKGHDGLNPMDCTPRTLRRWITDDVAYNESLEYARNMSFGAKI